MAVNNPAPSAFTGMKKPLYVPTVCLGNEGLRLLATQYVITDQKDRQGNIMIEDPVGHSKIVKLTRNPRQLLEAGLDNLGYDIRDCRIIPGV